MSLSNIQGAPPAGTVYQVSQLAPGVTVLTPQPPTGGSDRIAAQTPAPRPQVVYARADMRPQPEGEAPKRHGNAIAAWFAAIGIALGTIGLLFLARRSGKPASVASHASASAPKRPKSNPPPGPKTPQPSDPAATTTPHRAGANGGGPSSLPPPPPLHPPTKPQPEVALPSPPASLRSEGSRRVGRATIPEASTQPLRASSPQPPPRTPSSPRSPVRSQSPSRRRTEAADGLDDDVFLPEVELGSLEREHHTPDHSFSVVSDHNGHDQDLDGWSFDDWN